MSELYQNHNIEIKTISAKKFDDYQNQLSASQKWFIENKDDNYQAVNDDGTLTTFGKGHEAHTSDGRRPFAGIGVWIAAVFLLGEMAGGGVIAMPQAMSQAGWGGIAINILGCVVSMYTGFQLGWCWSILQERWPEYGHQIRKPYPEIGFRVGGRWMKYFVQFCVNFTVFGTAVAFLVLGSQNISTLIQGWWGWNLNYCWMMLVVTAALWPFTLFGTPKDFWPVAIGAILATSTAVVFVIIGTALDFGECQKKATYPAPTFVSFIQAYGTIAFAYGGHSAFPTIQHDMKKPEFFPKSVLYGYGIIFLLYFPMPIFAYVVYGSEVSGTVYLSIQTSWIQDVITVLVTGHVLFAFFIFINPITQDLEDVLGIPHHFTWKRICTRTLMVGIILFVGLSIPDFNTLLTLIGGTTIAAMTFVCPGPFYMVLRQKTAGVHRVKRHASTGKIIEPKNEHPVFSHVSKYGSQIAWWEWIVNGVVVIVGTFGGAATIYAVIDTWPQFRPPCYTVAMNGTY